MRARALALVGVLAGCHFAPNGAGSDGSGSHHADGGSADAFIPPIDAPAECTTWSAHGFDPCMLGAPGSAVELAASGSPYTYDTDVAGGVLTDHANTVLLMSPLTLQQSDGSTIAVLSVASFALDATAQLDVIGSKPLLVASWDTAVVGGTIDAGSHTTETDPTAHVQQSTQIGAGANVATACTAAAGMQGLAAVKTGGSGGGGGGALIGNGGGGAVGDQGCKNDDGTAATPCPRTGGIAGAKLAALPAVIVGGCAGAPSGTAGDGATAPATATTVALGGAGGGAIQISARTSLAIGGELLAGGAGGAGSPQSSAVGGGGGGAGGFLGLDSPSVMIAGAAIVAANGGAGGGSSPFNGFGAPGGDGAASEQAALGGSHAPGGGCGLPGANGAAGATGDGATATGTDSCGGGGGGGGIGAVMVWSADLQADGAKISPPAHVNPP